MALIRYRRIQISPKGIRNPVSRPQPTRYTDYATPAPEGLVHGRATEPARNEPGTHWTGSRLSSRVGQVYVTERRVKSIHLSGIDPRSSDRPLHQISHSAHNQIFNTRAQFSDQRPKYFSCPNLFVYTTTHCSLKAYCAILVRSFNLRHQASPRVSPRESTQRRTVELWERNVR